MAELHDVYFATNRNQLLKRGRVDFGDRFHKDGPQFYRAGLARVAKISDDPDEGYQVDEVTLAPESGKRNPARLGSTRIFTDLQASMRKENRDVLVYIHGFANDFSASLCRAAQIADIYKIERARGQWYRPHVFVFSWPSNGEVFPPWQYFSDRDDAEASGKAMARALLRLVDFLEATSTPDAPCRQRLHLVAHSMGNWALRHMVQGLRILGPHALRPLFENIFLMAADEDDDALEPAQVEKLGLLTRLGRRIHVYHSTDDGALVISDSTKFNPDRLGFGGPRSFSGLSTRITSIDCQLVDKSELTHLSHQYYRLREEVIQDVCALLSGQGRPDDLPWREIVEPGRRYRIRLADPETRPNNWAPPDR